jgi:hypothetical protein
MSRSDFLLALLALLPSADAFAASPGLASATSLLPAASASTADARPAVAGGESEIPSGKPAEGDSAPGSAGDFRAPTPRMLDLLQRTHHPKHWLFVTTTTERHRLRVDRIESRGLFGLHGHDGPPPAAALGWNDIAMIERRDSRQGSGRILGALFGAVALGYAGASIGDAVDTPYRSYNDHGAWIGIGAGAILGALAGGALGDGSARAIPLYAAQLEPGAPVEPAPVALWPAPIVDLDLVRKSTRPGDLLLVRGNFGVFAGRVDAIDANGLHGLHPDSKRDPGLGTLPDPLPWSGIASVDRLGNSAGRGAVITGLLGGVGVGLLAAAVAAGGLGLSTSGGNDAEVAGAFAGGTVGGGLVGAGIGALIGSGVETWHRVPGVSRPETPRP